MRLDYLAPLTVHDDLTGIISLVDKKGREVIHWSGFDSSALGSAYEKSEFARQLVKGFNALHQAKKRKGSK